MKDRTKKTKVVTITILVILAYVGVIIAWHVYSPTDDFVIQAPGEDNRPKGTERKKDDVLVGEFFMKYEEHISSLTGKWSCFRGETSNNIVKTTENINIGTEDYPIEWSIETGEGHASPVIYNGLVYFLDYDESLNSDALRCFSLETGKELWRRWYRVPIKRNHGFSRAAPVVCEPYIITNGPQGHIMCCDLITGEMKWSLDVQKQFKTEVPFWYAGQNPRTDGNTLVIAPAGEEVLMAGIDIVTGNILWQTPNNVKYKMSHSSIIPMTLERKKTYIYAGIGGVCGISAEEKDRGTLLWESSKWQPSVVAPSPLQISSNQLFLVAGYGAGGALMKVNQQAGKWTATVTEQYKPNEGLSSEQQTPILHNGLIYGVIPKDGGGLRGKLVSYSPSNLRNPVWSSGADERFGLGPYIIINDYLFVLKDEGELYVYDIKTKTPVLVKKQRIIDGIDAWGPMAYADGRLVLRDADTVICLKIN